MLKWGVGGEHSKETGLEANGDEPKYWCLVMCRDQNAGRSHNIKLGNKSFGGEGNKTYIWEQTYRIKILFRNK